MKIYRKVVFDIASRHVLEEDSFEYGGAIAECKGAGGGGTSSGTIGYPAYIETIHKKWVEDVTMPISMSDIINTALGTGGNPYGSSTTPDSAYDPSAVNTPAINSPLEKMKRAVSNLDNVVKQVSYTPNWDSMVNKANTKIAESGIIDKPSIASLLTSLVSTARTDAGLLTTDIKDNEVAKFDVIMDAAIAKAAAALASAPISAILSAFSSEQAQRRSRATAQFLAGMADANATSSTAFIWGMGLIKLEFSKEDALFNAQFKFQAYEQGLQSYLAVAIDMIRTYLGSYLDRIGTEVKGQVSEEVIWIASRSEMFRSMVTQQFQQLGLRVQGEVEHTTREVDIQRMTIVALKEEFDKQLAIDVGYAEWDLRVYQYGANLLAAPHGGVVDPSRMDASQGASAIGGVFAGAATGAMIGSTIPGIGTGIGAVVGGIIGGLGAIL